MRKTVAIVISTFLCFVVLIITKNEYARLLYSNATYGMPALLKQGEIDNLYLGTSMFRQGIDINVLEEECEKTSYVLAYNGNQPVFEVLQLKYLLSNGLKIKHLYVDMCPYVVNTETSIADEKMFVDGDLAFLRSAWNVIDNKTFSTWWQMFVSANNEQIVTFPISSAIVNSQFRHGGTLVQNSGMNEDTYSNMVPQTGDDYIYDEQAEAIAELIDICKKENITLTFIETPKPEAVQKDSLYLSIMNEYKELVVSKGVSDIICGEDMQVKASYFIDRVHLSSEGRREFTKWMLER